MKKISINKYFLFACAVLAAWLFYASISQAPESPMTSMQTSNYDIGFFSEENNEKEFVKNIGEGKKALIVDNPQSIDEPSGHLESEQKIKKYLRSSSSELMMAIDLQEKFDADEIDTAIATDSEKNLAYVFYQGMEWQEFSPHEINCKKNICRVELAILTPEKKSQLMELLSAQMMATNIRFMYAIPVSLAVENKEIIYFIKKFN